MEGYDYQIAAGRTECDQQAAAERIYDQGLRAVRTMHAVLGLTGEVGELSTAVEKWLYYRQNLDRANVKEELGDCLWYIAELCRALDLSLTDVMDCNLAKLKLRYPERYKDELAEERVRNRVAERKAMLESDREYRLTPDYPRLCTRCTFTPVHKSNAIGVCPNCIKPGEVAK